jgi:hypothetical protein
MSLLLVILFFALLIGIFMRLGRAAGPKPRLFDRRCKHCRGWIDMNETECPHCNRAVRQIGLSSFAKSWCDHVRPPIIKR